MTRERMIGMVLLCGTALVLGGGLFYAAAHREDGGARDRERCLQGTEKPGTLVLIDRTDPFSVDQQVHVRRVVEGLAEDLPKEARLALHVITGDAQESALPWVPPGQKRGFAWCKTHDLKAINPVVETERFVRKAYDREFAGPLAAVLDELVKGGEAARSPILEALEAATWGTVRADRIVIISDLLQHSDLSHLGAALPDVCALAASGLGERLKARLAGRRIVLHQLRNHKHARRQTPVHRAWWARLFYRLEVAEVRDSDVLVPRLNNDCAPPALNAATAKRKRG